MLLLSHCFRRSCKGFEFISYLSVLYEERIEPRRRGDRKYEYQCESAWECGDESLQTGRNAKKGNFNTDHKM